MDGFITCLAICALTSVTVIPIVILAILIKSSRRQERTNQQTSDLLAQNFLCYDGEDEVHNQIHAYLSTNFKDLRNLPKNDSKLVAKARDRWYVPDSNKASDLEKLRERALLKEFEEYLPAPKSEAARQAGRESKSKRLKVFRLEAVRVCIKKAWQDRDFPTIIEVANKIPDNILQEDPKLLMWYDQALTRSGG